MIKSNYEVWILVHGHPVKEYYKDGKTYIEGRKGIEFSLKIKNNGYKRILAVPTIDGLSVLNGKEASYNSPGYIIDGYDSIVIEGWRTSKSEIAKFYFTNPEDSYSKRTGKKDNLGVIGVAIFKERESIYRTFINEYQEQYFFEGSKIWPWWREGSDNWTLTNTSQSTLSLNSDNTNLSKSFNKINCASNVSQDIGTGFGKNKESQVTTVEFNREDNSDAVFTIFYNIRKQLEKIGVDFNERPKYAAPQAFPNGFCEPPK